MNTDNKQDSELGAMQLVHNALDPLPNDTRARVLRWALDRYNLHADQPLTDESLKKAGARDYLPHREGTINEVVAKLGSDSCRQLLLASAAYLTIYKRMDRFAKSELIRAAEEAHAWKSVYSKQISINIKRMQKAKELFEKSKDVFALSPSKKKEMEEMLAE